jgi:hypothetical protein
MVDEEKTHGHSMQVNTTVFKAKILMDELSEAFG